MKVTSNEGRPHLTLVPKGALTLVPKWPLVTQGCTLGDQPIRSPQLLTGTCPSRYR